MGRPVVGIYASAAPTDWGPWRGRPSAVAPAALGAAVRRAGAIVVLLAPGEDPGLSGLLSMLDALIVLDDGEATTAVQAAVRDRGVRMLVLDAARITPDSTVDDCARELAGLGLAVR